MSKATLAVCYQVDGQLRQLEVSNTLAGFAQLVQTCGADSLYVMEATGTYNLALAYYLHGQGARIAVVNPLIIKRFIQMHLGKGKSDRKDAQWLMRYGQQQVTTAWQPEEALLVECRQLEQVSEQLLKQRPMVSNSLEALTRQPVISPLALRQLQHTKQLLEEQLKTIEQEMLALLEKRYAQEMCLSQSIPGIGRKIAGMLLLLADGFTSYTNHRQLIAKAGLSPREHTSGTSIRGKVRLTQDGRQSDSD